MTYEKKETLIDIKGVSLSFGSKVILKDVNATIKNIVRPDNIQGQVVCFLGPSGIGKTQLSRIIAGLQAPSSGHVLLNGIPTCKGNVGMVPQTYTLFEFATVQENLSIAVNQSNSKGDFKGLLDYFEMNDHLLKYPHQLSGGQRQRVSIIRQLLVGHKFIVMDEPFSGLDIKMKSKACELITKVANLDELHTIIIVTHDVTEGMSIADTVWLMGRDRNKEGAHIVAEYDLAAEGLCWQPDLFHNPDFQRKVIEVKEKFLEISAN